MTKSNNIKNILSSNLFYFIVLLVYLVLCFYFLSINNENRLFSSTDPQDYIISAEGLLECKNFAYKYDNCLPKSWNMPGYPLFISMHMLIFENYIFFVIFSQLILLLLTAYFSKKIIDLYYPNISKWVFLLVLFNPNSYLTANLIQTETLFTFLLVYFIYLLNVCKNYKEYVLLGFITATCAYVRPAFYYFTLISPFVFFIYAKYFRNINYKKSIYMASISGIISLMLVGLWVNRNYHIFNEPVFVSNSGAYVWDNLIEISRLENDNKKIVEKYNILTKQISEKYPVYGAIQTPMSSKILIIEAKKEFDFSFDLIIKATIKSLTNLYLSGGGANLERLITGEEKSFSKLNKSYMDFTFNFKSLINEILSIHFFPILFSIFIKILSLFGIIFLILKSNFKFIVLTLFPIVYLTPLYGFIGQSRFRVPLEPSFAILATLGIFYIYLILKKYKNVYFN